MCNSRQVATLKCSFLIAWGHPLITRRAFTGLLAASIAVGAPGRAFAVPDGVGTQPAYELPDQVPRLAALLRKYQAIAGAEAPEIEEIRYALKLRAAIDKKGEARPFASPYEVAYLYYRIGQGEFPDYDASYTKEWPVRANPLIVGFFDATDLRRPDRGDITPWCAAFLNSCIETAIKSGASKDWRPTRGADSKSFRKWGRALKVGEEPQHGDICVYVNGTTPTAGHAAFYHATTKNGYMLLGGNQGPGDRSNGGEVNIKPFRSDNPSLRLHSVRTIRS